MFKMNNPERSIFEEDLIDKQQTVERLMSESSFLVVGGAGSIGQAVVKSLLRRNAKLVHVVDISENNLVELVREVRSTLGNTVGGFETFAIDFSSSIFSSFFTQNGPYDYVLNLAALKHVRSERDPFTIAAMIETNVIGAANLAALASHSECKNYFCVSTDKAADPVNLMGGTKRLMENFLTASKGNQNLSMARFANVAFSDGSLLHSFQKRLEKRQPISAPSNVWRYFISNEEASDLCLISTLFGSDGEIFYPKDSKRMKPINLMSKAIEFVEMNGYQVLVCENEFEARQKAAEAISKKFWPCYFFESDTDGEKNMEKFLSGRECVDVSRFKSVGVITNHHTFVDGDLALFVREFSEIKSRATWLKSDMVELIQKYLPDFTHHATGHNLHDRM